MKIIVAGAHEASSRAAHAINTIKMAEGFARIGHEVSILCFESQKGKVSAAHLAELYGLTAPLNWIQLPRKLLFHYLDSQWDFGRLALWIARRFKPDLLHARNYILPFLSSRSGIPTSAECHGIPGQITPEFRKLIEASQSPSFHALVSISQYLVDQLIALGAPAQKMVALPNGVDLPVFQRPLKLPTNPFPARPNVVYAGHLYDFKGIPTILDAAKYIPEVNIHFVGGFPEDIARHQATVRENHITNVVFHGMKLQSELPQYLWHADALILTHTLKRHSSQWTSPLKLGEYLASGTPIIAADIPAHRALVDESEVEFILPDDAISLANGIKKILSDSRRANLLSQNAMKKAQQLTYEKRAQSILDFIQGRQS